VIGLQAVWIPKDGAEKTWAVRVVSLSPMVWQMLGIFGTPRLTERFGWAAAACAYGALVLACAAVWQLWAARRPAEWRGWPTMVAAERKLLRAGASLAAAASSRASRSRSPSAGATPKGKFTGLAHSLGNFKTLIGIFSPTYGST
jgi:MFS-type transporter involved in bile tolerance (Atg22 family)